MLGELSKRTYMQAWLSFRVAQLYEYYNTEIHIN